MFKQFCRVWVSCLLFCLTAQGVAATYSEITFGPEQVTRQNGQPATARFAIPVPYPLQHSQYFVIAEGVSTGAHPVKARIWLNNDKPGESWVLRTPVTKQLALGSGSNTLQVEVFGNPGDVVSLSIKAVVEDDELPRITAQVDPAANAAGWQRAPVTVSFACADAITGVAFCSEAVQVGEGANQIITGTARDKAGNEASVSVTLNVDLTPPEASLALDPSLNASGWQSEPVTASVTCLDNLSGVLSCPPPQTFVTEGANQQVAHSVSDIAGNTTPVNAVLNLDFTAPSLTATVTPAANVTGWHSTAPTVSYACNDALSGVASCPEPITVSQDGMAIKLTNLAWDLAGNTAVLDTVLNVDLTPPQLALSSPDASAPLAIRTPTFVFAVTDMAPDFASASLTWAGAELGAGCAGEGTVLTCTPAAPLAVAPGELVLSLSDFAGHTGSLAVPLSFDVDQDGVADHLDQCPDSSAGETVDENGCPVNRDADNDGVLDHVDQCPNTAPGVTVGEDGCDPTQRDTDGDGVVDIEDPLPEDPDRSTLPIVTISSPQTLATFGMSPVLVTGTVDVSAVNFTVNGAGVPFDDQGNWYANVHLDEGHNTVVARMVDPSGVVSTATLSLSLDLTPPYLTVESHTDGQVVMAQPVAISGLVNDIVRGTIEAEEAMVMVNGQEAAIVNRSYLAENVPLQEGENRITVQGRDQAGNLAEETFTLVYKPPQGQRLELITGQGQSGGIEEILPAPLTVRVLDDAGQPVADKPVVFRVAQGAGLVAAGTALEGRGAMVRTDDNGLASTPFKLGFRAGTGNHKVRARVVGYDDEIVFHASARANIGDKLSVNSGNNQRVAVFSPLPAPFVTVVTDNGANVVKGARVEFKVTQGNGKFENGETSILKVTDSDGRASAHYTAGGNMGLDSQRITASLLDGPEGQTITAGFTVSAFVPGDPGQTSISGLVVDNQNQPLPGVTVRVDGTTRKAVADTQGRFRIDNVPVGPVHLIADGSTVEVDGEYPSLAYNLVTVSGVDNPLPAPIYMVKLNTDNAVWAGPENTVLTLPDVPGFKLEIPAHSVTFPDGSREGYVSVTVVNSNTIPMTPPNGMQPQFIVTIQPTNALFDPPARLTLPNVDAHMSGRQVEMFSFDHDLEEFVAIGLGTVSEDATTIRSNPGVGIVRAGWHCGAQPGGSGCCEGGSGKDCGHCYDKKGNCPANCELVPERSAETQIKGNCTTERCGDDKPGDDPNDKGECEICEEGSDKPQPDESKNDSECEDGCGTCVNGSCEIDEEKLKPEDQQDPKDCKTLLCGGDSLHADETPVDKTLRWDCKKTICENKEAVVTVDDADRDPECAECNGDVRADKPDKTACYNTSDKPNDCRRPGCFMGVCISSGRPSPNDKPIDENEHDCFIPDCTDDGAQITSPYLGNIKDALGRCMLCSEAGMENPCQESYEEKDDALRGDAHFNNINCISPIDLRDFSAKPKDFLRKLIISEAVLCVDRSLNDLIEGLNDARSELERCYQDCAF